MGAGRPAVVVVALGGNSLLRTKVEGSPLRGERRRRRRRGGLRGEGIIEGFDQLPPASSKVRHQVKLTLGGKGRSTKDGQAKKLDTFSTAHTQGLERFSTNKQIANICPARKNETSDKTSNCPPADSRG